MSETLHDDAAYAALTSRDRRYDGRVWFGVTSTGIYCRPVCPARTPMRRNVRFFATPAAAVAAGFRACRRCRPDAAPGSRHWDHGGDLTARALRLVADGIVDREGVAGLAAAVHVSPRHVHRLLVAEVGATPMELAVSRRSQTARLLLEQTELSMTEIAFAAGFSSIRSFNEVMRAEFGATPSELRAMRRSGQRVPAPGGLTLRLPRRLPYDNANVGDFLAARTIPGVERHESVVGGWRHTRTLDLRFGVAVVTVESYDDAPDVLIRAESLDLRDTATLVSRLRRWLDLDADPDSIAEVLGRDAELAALLLRRPGLRVVTTVDPWETLVRAVVGQQVSVAGARTMLGRLVDRLSAAEGDELSQFPPAQAFVDSSPEELASIGMPVARGRALRDVALAVIAGDVDLSFGSSPSDVADELVSIRGIGPWTADYVRLRGLADPDAFPAGDLVIRRVATDLGIAGTARELAARSLSWSPWRAYAATHLWAASADTPTTKESG